MKKILDIIVFIKNIEEGKGLCYNKKYNLRKKAKNRK